MARDAAWDGADAAGPRATSDPASPMPGGSPPSDPGTPPLGPDAGETLARASADLRAGLPLHVGASILGSVETLSPARATLLLSRAGACLAVTARRAATLRARAYDGDVARIAPPPGADPAWARGTADPTADLSRPLRGPFDALRGGDASDARAGVALARAAQLLPAVLVAPAGGLSLDGLTSLTPEAVLEGLRRPRALARAGAARVPLAVSEARPRPRLSPRRRRARALRGGDRPSAERPRPFGAGPDPAAFRPASRAT